MKARGVIVVPLKKTAIRGFCYSFIHIKLDQVVIWTVLMRDDLEQINRGFSKNWRVLFVPIDNMFV